jgi:hypothetical protein
MTDQQQHKQSALAVYNDCVKQLRDISAQLGEAATHHPIAALIKRSIDKALRYAPTFPGQDET